MARFARPWWAPPGHHARFFVKMAPPGEKQFGRCAIGYLLARAKLGFPVFKDRETGARLAAETLRDLKEKGIVGDDLKPLERVA